MSRRGERLRNITPKRAVCVRAQIADTPTPSRADVMVTAVIVGIVTLCLGVIITIDRTVNPH